MNRLEGKVAIVTGSASGIGRTIAFALAQEGASVVIADILERPQSRGYEADTIPTAQVINQRWPGRASFVQTDVTQPDSVENVVQEAVKTFGRLDIMVNVAGVFVGSKPIVDETIEEYEKTMMVNCRGTFLGIKYAIAQMLKQDRPVHKNGQETSRGRIINMSSTAGLVGISRQASYSASKGAVLSLTRQVALDYAKDEINVNAVCPGAIKTGMTRDYFEDSAITSYMQGACPWPRLGTTSDIAKAVVFLASDESYWITGTALPVDGGVVAVR